MHKLWLTTAIVFLVFSLSAVQVFSSEQQKIVMASVLPEEHPTGKMFSLIYTEAFRRLGLNMEYRHLPGSRASITADQGKVDGEIARAHSYGNEHPTLVEVQEPVLCSSYAAFTMDPTIELKGWESLRHTEYKVDYGRGDCTSARKLTGIIPSDRLSAISTWRQGLKKLALGRTDILIGPKNAIAILANTSELKQFVHRVNDEGAEIRIAGVMENFCIHAFLNGKHKDLARRLSKIIKEMKDEGLISKYQEMNQP